VDGDGAAEKAASGPGRHRARLAILFAYLFLVALYESWNIPPARGCLSSSVAVPGAIVCVAWAGLASTSMADRPGRVGGTRRQDGILIVEFAVEQRRQGKELLARDRRSAACAFRPV